MRNPVYGSPARMRVEREATRRRNGSVVVSTVLSLLVVAAAVAVVAYLVLRTPSSAVDSAERLDPVGTALPAPSEPPTLPTPIPTEEPEPAAIGFTGEAPEVTGLPTVAAPQEAGPTPTPRVVALPTAVPPTAAPPPPTLPPSVPVEDVPVVALAPVESAAPAAPPANVAETEADSEPIPVPEEPDDDPFNIFDDGDGSRIVPAQNDALERARALQDEARRGDGDEQDPNQDDFDVPAIVPAGDAAIVDRRDGSVEIVMPDVDAMIDEITAQVTDPNRNPNVGDAGRPNDQDRNENDRNQDGDQRDASPAENRRKSARERVNDRFGRRTPTSESRSARDDNTSVSERAGTNNGSRDQDECRNPFENIPEDLRPEGFPFDNC